MHVHAAIEHRRAYRALDPVTITDETIHELARAASLAPSCYNKQPWRFVFVRGKDTLATLHSAYMKGNEWCRDASLMIAVCTRKENDCLLHDEDPHPERAYHQFDTGLATSSLLLRAAELGLTTHPIAGYYPNKVREVLAIPKEYQVLAMVSVGSHAQPGDDPERNQLIEEEATRPPRKPFEEFASIDTYDIKG